MVNLIFSKIKFLSLAVLRSSIRTLPKVCAQFLSSCQPYNGHTSVHISCESGTRNGTKMHTVRLLEYIEGEIISSVTITPQLLTDGGAYLSDFHSAVNVSVRKSNSTLFLFYLLDQYHYYHFFHLHPYFTFSPLYLPSVLSLFLTRSIPCLSLLVQ